MELVIGRGASRLADNCIKIEQRLQGGLKVTGDVMKRCEKCDLIEHEEIFQIDVIQIRVFE